MAVNFKNETVKRHTDLSDKIKDNLVVEDSSIKEKESHSAYYNCLPEGIDKKTVDELTKYNSKFVTAAHVAVGELAADCMLKNDSINEVNAEIGYLGKSDKININVARKKTYQNHLTDDPTKKEVVKHLVMHSTVDSISSKGYGVKAVKEAMSEEFQDMFKK